MLRTTTTATTADHKRDLVLVIVKLPF
jgi:hypothetical protein